MRLILLTRNFGHQAAICAGLDFARGRFVAVMDADLQDAPELLPKMYEAATKEGVDVVYGVRSRREGSWLKRLAYRAFYAVYGYAAETPIDRDSGDFCLLSRRSLTMLATLPEKNRFLRGLRSWTGLRSKAFAMDRPERAAGRPQYSWAKLISLALNGITSFSSKPLRLATIAGTLLCAISALMTVFYLAAWYVYDLHSKVPGFTTIIILILFLSGIQFLMMGIIGEYIAQIFQEVKHRPTYLVDRTVNVPGGRSIIASCRARRPLRSRMYDCHGRPLLDGRSASCAAAEAPLSRPEGLDIGCGGVVCGSSRSLGVDVDRGPRESAQAQWPAQDGSSLHPIAGRSWLRLTTSSCSSTSSSTSTTCTATWTPPCITSGPAAGCSSTSPRSKRCEARMTARRGTCAAMTAARSRRRSRVMRWSFATSATGAPA